MRVNSFLGVLEDLFLEPISQVKDDIVSISFNRKSEEVDLKLDT